MEVSTPSGLPSHLETLSASAPVGQTDTQAPQNSQPAATCEAAEGGTDERPGAAVLERQHRSAAHLVAHAHAAPAEDAEVVVAVEERVVVLGLEPAVGDRVADLGDADPLHHLLQLAVAVVRAAPAAGRDAGLADRRLAPPAVVVLAAQQAARRMLREDQSQDLLAHLAQGDGVGRHLHAVGDERAASQRIAPRALDLDRAQATAAERRELLVGTQRGHVHPGELGGAQDGGPFGDRDRAGGRSRGAARGRRDEGGAQASRCPLDSITIASPAMASKRQTS